MNQPYDEIGMSALFQQLQTTSPLDPEPVFEEGGFSTMSASSTVPRIGQLQEELHNRSAMLEVNELLYLNDTCWRLCPFFPHQQHPNCSTVQFTQQEALSVAGRMDEDRQRQTTVIALRVGD